MSQHAEEDLIDVATGQKRQITLTYNPLQNAVDQNLNKADKLSCQLREAVKNVDVGEKIEHCLPNVEALALKYDTVVQELVCLYKQNRNSELQEERLTEHEKYLNYVVMIVKKIKNRLSDKSSETSMPRAIAPNAPLSVKSTKSRRSKSSFGSTTSSAARILAMSEAAAANKEAEYERAVKMETKTARSRIRI